IGLLNLPYDLAGGRDFQNAVAVAGAEQGVAAGQANGGKDLVANPPGPGTPPRFLPEKGNGELPPTPPGRSVFPHDAVGFVTNQVVAVRKLANEPRVGVRMRVIDLEFEFLEHFAVAIDFDDPARPAFGDHQAAVGKRLKGVDLDLLPGVLRAFG